MGPGAANNSKEGAGLIPTVAFGIPGNSGMAILLGAFFLLGLIPGPDMLTKHLTLTYSMVWTIALSNIVVVAVCFLFINRIANLTTLRGNLLIPFILFLCFIGAFTSNNHIGDLIVLVLFGGIGYFMVRYHWPRPPFILGFILGRLAENYLYVSISRYGASWLYRPKVIFIFLIAVAFVLYHFFQKKAFKKGEPDEV